MKPTVSLEIMLPSSSITLSTESSSGFSVSKSMEGSVTSAIATSGLVGVSVCILLKVSIMVRLLRVSTDSESSALGDEDDSTTTICAVGGLVFESSFESPK